MTLIFLLLGVLSVIWVGVDASKRDFSAGGSGGTSTATWVIGCILLWIVIFPLYLFKRGKAPLKADVAAAAAQTAATGPASVPAGWYQNPDNASQLRYWTGTAWTNQTAAMTPDPAAVPAAAPSS